VRTEKASLIFDLPEGRLRFAEHDLDTWAEHLTWCYRLMGVADGATIAVQDFGTSPLAFLGSALLMPHLREGVAERLGGRFIGLDASPERVTLTPAVLSQVGVDVLVVRADVADLLSEMSQRAGRAPDRLAARMIVVFGDDEPFPVRAVPWRYLLHVEPALLLAPECPDCGLFHLRRGFYDVKHDLVRNLRLGSARRHRLRQASILEPGHCGLSPDDWCIRYPARMAGG
jgi:hypothetical protein